MAVRRRAFALLIVLVVASATFALAIQGAVAVRSATVEASTMRAHASAERDALSAATIVLASLTAGAKLETDVIGGGSSSSGSAAAELDESELPDMPPEMRELVRGLLRGQPQDQDGAGSVSQRSSTIVKRGGPFTTLRERGLPRNVMRTRMNNREFLVTLSDSTGGINLNTAEEDQLVRYFRAIGLDTLRASSIAHELLDWRDEDNLPRTRGAERETYVRHNITPRNGQLQTIEELLFLPSMSREVLDAIQSDLTLVGDGKIHVHTASRAVLLSAPDMSEQAAQRILALRDSGGLTEESLDEALGALASDAEEVFRFKPGSMIMLRLEPVGEGPAYRVDASIDDNQGVQILGIRMISRN